jgi:hypothetical protein
MVRVFSTKKAGETAMVTVSKPGEVDYLNNLKPETSKYFMKKLRNM